MELSSEWRSPWTISASFSAPSLLLDTGNGPLLFSPCRHHQTLLSSPSLFPHVPPPVHPITFQRDLISYFRSSTDTFASSATQSLLFHSLLPHLDNPILSNHLHALPSRHRPHILFLFFPVGENAHNIGYLALSRNRHLVCEPHGGVFQQREGFRHPSHRIIQILPRATEDDDETNYKVEGYLIAATMYAVNWFRVETAEVSSAGSTMERPVLVPMMNQAFKERVVSVCWNPHLGGETVVLLESGMAVIIDLNSRRGVTYDASMEGELGEPIGCDFGGQPWILLVAGTQCVMALDLRCGKSSTLARIDNSDIYKMVHSMEDDGFVAFCRADFDYSYFSVVTKYHLILFDVRQPLSPILTWDHGISNPCYVGMFRLSDLRSVERSAEAPWSDGYAILVASLWEDTFKLFCYGKGSKEGFCSPCFCAWELPSRVSFSGRDYCSADYILKEDFFKYVSKEGPQWQEKKDLVLGFYVCPISYLNSYLGLKEAEGFDLIRIMSSGKLEVQSYRALWSRLIEKSGGKRVLVSRSDVSLFYHWNESDMRFRHLDGLKFTFLNAYLKGNVFEALTKSLEGRRINGVQKGVACNHILLEVIDEFLSYYRSKSISDVTFPASVHELALRQVLMTPFSTLLYLSFSTYQDLSSENNNISLEFFEVPRSLANKRVPPLMTGRPSQRSTRWSHKVRPGDGLLGPILPLPVVVALEHILNGKVVSSQPSQSDDLLINEQCDKIRRHFFPEISLANAVDVSDTSVLPGDENPFFTMDVLVSSGACMMDDPMDDKQPSSQSQLERNTWTSSAFDEQNFTTFISGIHDIHEVKPERACILDTLDDLSCLRLDYEFPDINFSPTEDRVYSYLGKQFFKWQGKFSPYKEFCISKKIPGKTA